MPRSGRQWRCGASRPPAIHAFEIVPDISSRLVRRFESASRVVVNRRGLDVEAGSVEVHYCPSFDEGSGLHDAHVGFASEIWEAEVVTGDAYCREHGIAGIDFLKIDVEGGEDRVLQGFETMLAANAIEVIQFEYGVPNIVSTCSSRISTSVSADTGTRFESIYPKHVDFAPYDRRIHEDFRGPNYVAVAGGQSELVRRLEQSTA